MARKYACGLCGLQFSNPWQLGPHARQCRQLNQVVQFAEFDDEINAEFATVTPSQVPTPTPQLPHGFCVRTQVPTPTPSLPHLQLPDFCVRTNNPKLAVAEDVPLVHTYVVVPNPSLSRDFCPMQKFWDRYVQGVYHLCDPHFWDVFEAVHMQPTNCVDAVVSTTADLLHKKCVPVKCWPRSKRRLRSLIATKIGHFWPRVSITKTIDLTQFHLPGVSQVRFSFLDPVFVWIRQAQLLVERGKRLVWKPKILRQQPSNEPMYGSGVEYGLLLKNAAASVTQGGYPALMNISWDSGATNMKSRSAVPICMQVT